MFLKQSTSAALLLLVLAVASVPDVQARGFGMHFGGGMRMGGRSSSRGMMHFGRGRGGRRGNYNTNANQGPTAEQQQASLFQERQAQNPYSNVAEHVNVSNYIKQYR